MKRLTANMGYRQIAWEFFKAGAITFGGWSSTALLLEKEFVNKKKILSKVQLHGAVTYAQIIPGGTQTAIVANVGYRLKGSKGSAVATIFYLLPAHILILLFAIVYFHYLQESTLADHLAIIRAALGGIILSNAYRIGKNHVNHSPFWLLVIIGFVIKLLLDLNAALIILTFGIGGIILSVIKKRRRT